MKPIAILLALVVSPLSLAQFGQNKEMEALRQYKAQQEMQRMEEEFNHPKTIEIAKDRAVLGQKSAPILMVEYSDFQCPYCKNGYQTVDSLRKKYGKKLKVVFKHMPLDMHPQAMPAAKRFEAIALHSSKKAYEFYDEVFQNQEKLTSEGEAFLDSVVKKIGLKVDKVRKDMESQLVKDHITADIAEAKSLGILGTPGFVVAGVTVKGAYPQEVFEGFIDRRLKKNAR